MKQKIDEQFRFAKANYLTWNPTYEEMIQIVDASNALHEDQSMRNEYYNLGLELYNKLDCEKAIPYFKKAYECSADGNSSHYLSASLFETADYIGALNESVNSLSFAKTGGYGDGTRLLSKVYFYRGLSMFYLLRAAEQVNLIDQDLINFARENLKEAENRGEVKASEIMNKLSLIK